MRTSARAAALILTVLTALPATSAQAATAAGRAYVNGATGMCLAVGKGEAKAGKPVIQRPCTDGGKAQEWDYNGQRLYNKATKMCLAIGRGEKRKGKKAVQWHCAKSAEQTWTRR